MADLAGGVIPEGAITFGTTEHRTTGSLSNRGSPAFGITEHRATGGFYSFQGGGGAVTYWYSLRVRDDGVGPPAVYRVWSSTDPDSSPPGLPPVGSWVERTILDVWTL